MNSNLIFDRRLLAALPGTHMLLSHGAFAITLVRVLGGEWRFEASTRWCPSHFLPLVFLCGRTGSSGPQLWELPVWLEARDLAAADAARRRALGHDAGDGRAQPA